MKIEWLEIRQYKHVEPGTRIEFGPGVNVIVGRNGAGKTTLLKLLEAIASSRVGALHGEALAFKYLASDEHLTLDVEVEQQDSKDDQDSFQLTGREPPMLWSVRVTARSRRSNDQAVVTVSSQNGILTDQEAGVTSEPKFNNLAEAWAGCCIIAPIQLLSKSKSTDVNPDVWPDFMLAFSPNRVRMDEGLDIFRTLHSTTSTSSALTRIASAFSTLGELIPAAYPLTRQLGRGWSGPASLSADLIDQLSGPDTPFALEFDSQTNPFLADTATKLGFARLRLHIPRVSGEPTSNGMNYTFRGLSVYATLRDGTEFNQESFSFGQKRLFTFLWLADSDPTGPLLADELGNGMHHDWITACMDVIGDRQAFIASQNPLIFDHLTFADADAARRALIRCQTVEGEDGRAQWRWANPTQAQAERLFASYEANFQHVSEILRDEGLW